MIQFYLVHALLILQGFDEVKKCGKFRGVGYEWKRHLYLKKCIGTLAENSYVITHGICHNTWYPGISEITTPLEKAFGTDKYDNDVMRYMALKLPRYFYLLRTFQSLVYCTNRQPSRTRKHLFLYHQGDRSGLRKPEKNDSRLFASTAYQCQNYQMGCQHQISISISSTYFRLKRVATWKL